MERITQYPATILTGFLGAGKTTLLNRLIKENPDKKFAVIENEFGDINIDSSLVVSEDKGIYELTDGCVCCTLSDELANTLAELHESDFEFNHLIIETTGIADPNGVASSFFDDYIRDLFYIDGTICLVDAANLEQSLKDEEVIARQITFSNIILLNKVDMIDETEIERITNIVKEINPTAKVIPTKNADYGKNNLVGIDAFQTVTTEQELLNLHHHHHEHNGIKSLSFIFDEPFNMHDFQYNMSLLMDEYQDRIYRVKGIVHEVYNDEKIVFQTVRANGLASTGSKWGPFENRQSKFVFIGKDLDKEFIESKLSECIFNEDAF